jgi:hypothetical protein
MITERQKKRIYNYLDRCLEFLNMTYYKIHVRFVDSLDGPAAEAQPDARYIRAVITFDKGFVIDCFKKNNFNELKEVCLHELVHVLLNPLLSTLPLRGF